MGFCWGFAYSPDWEVLRFFLESSPGPIVGEFVFSPGHSDGLDRKWPFCLLVSQSAEVFSGI